MNQIKKQIRIEYSQKRNNLTDRYRSSLDKMLFERTVNSDIYKRSDIVLAYFPIRNEPDVLPIVLHALENGKRVAFPISHIDSFELSFRYVNRIDELISGTYAIPEPKETNELYVGEKSAICIVPGLVFDRRGYRIGYGKGFYDRFLFGFKGFSLGLVYDDFLCDELPTEDTDVSVDIIISDREELFIYER